MKLTLDRRRHRTDDPAEALRLQLDAVRRRAALDALVLADGDGLVIAHAGDRDGCAALAAAAPLVGRASGPRALVPADAGRRDVRAAGATLHLVGTGGRLGRDAALADAARGVARILGG
jgi:hypothetical protein